MPKDNPPEFTNAIRLVVRHQITSARLAPGDLVYVDLSRPMRERCLTLHTLPWHLGHLDKLLLDGTLAPIDTSLPDLRQRLIEATKDDAFRRDAA